MRNDYESVSRETRLRLIAQYVYSGIHSLRKTSGKIAFAIFLPLIAVIYHYYINQPEIIRILFTLTSPFVFIFGGILLLYTGQEPLPGQQDRRDPSLGQLPAKLLMFQKQARRFTRVPNTAMPLFGRFGFTPDLSSTNSGGNES